MEKRIQRAFVEFSWIMVWFLIIFKFTIWKDMAVWIIFLPLIIFVLVFNIDRFIGIILKRETDETKKK